ncbi:class I SAM-dependent methyltransferase [Candidatus Aerophobetes bacterium]|nr:class I SAM-dependent methyltransferase [Candidatus Aerophobetes bacterium]
MSNHYPKSRVEIKGFTAKYYDTLMNVVTFGKYSSFIEKVIELMRIRPTDRILDLGAGTGRNACLIMRYLSLEGELVSLDISKEMIVQFEKRCANFSNVKIINQRIDQPLPYKDEFDKVFICFVLHGFPQTVREVIIDNAFRALKNGGEFFILDYNEFSLRDTPFYLTLAFKLIECPYAFDFIKKDWKEILSKVGFNHFKKHYFFSKYVRLLKVVKNVE